MLKIEAFTFTRFHHLRPSQSTVKCELLQWESSSSLSIKFCSNSITQEMTVLAFVNKYSLLALFDFGCSVRVGLLCMHTILFWVTPVNN